MCAKATTSLICHRPINNVTLLFEEQKKERKGEEKKESKVRFAGKLKGPCLEIEG